MYLLICATLISFSSVLLPLVTKPLSKWLKRPTAQQRQLTSEINYLKNELSTMSMVHNFAAYAKIERKIISREKELKCSSSTEKTIKIELVINLGSKILFGLILCSMVIYYRYTPVIVFPDNYYLYPLNNIISYPNAESGAVSMHFWMVICNQVKRIIKL